MRKKMFAIRLDDAQRSTIELAVCRRAQGESLGGYIRNAALKQARIDLEENK
jgi:hypothetical protein